MTDSEQETQRDATTARIKSYVERVERLDQDRLVICEDIKEVFGEAKAAGFDVKAMRKIIALRKMDDQKRNEEEQILELYKNAVGLT